MVDFKIIDNINEVHSNHEWVDALNFKSKNRIVNDKGETVAADYAARRYRLIAKQERKFSRWERLARALLGSWLVLRSCGGELLSKKVQNLFLPFYFLMKLILRFYLI